jgi:hypothetical protein
MPWDYLWVVKRPHERAYYDEVGERIRTAPLLRDAVSFDAQGPDVASWMRKVGWVLSVSDDESFHLAPAEGMASRAVPVIVHWPGAEDMYPPQWIHPSTFAAAEAIKRGVTDGSWHAQGEAACGYIQKYSLENVLPMWERLVLDGRPATIASS